MCVQRHQVLLILSLPVQQPVVIVDKHLRWPHCLTAKIHHTQRAEMVVS